MPDKYFSNDDSKGFFSDPAISKNKCSYLSKYQDVALRWEYVTSSNYSSNVVSNEEEVARLILSPIHIDKETGDIFPAAYEDVSNKGLSVNRLSMHKSKNTIHQIGEEKANRDRERNPNREYIGFAIASVNAIRSEVENSVRNFAVYDTALEDITCHADVCLINQGPDPIANLPPKAARMQRRLKLKNIFNKFVDKS